MTVFLICLFISIVAAGFALINSRFAAVQADTEAAIRQSERMRREFDALVKRYAETNGHEIDHGNRAAVEEQIRRARNDQGKEQR